MNIKKILILNPNMPPRAIKFLNLLVKKSVFDYKILFYSVSSKNRRWNVDKKVISFKYKILRSFEIGFGIKDYFPFIITLDFIYELLKLKPDVIVVPGWADMPSYTSAIYCLLSGCKLILRSESTENEKSLRRTLFAPITKFMVRTASSFIVSGTRAKKYLISLGATPKKVFIGYSPIDVNFFKRNAVIDEKQKNIIKKQINIPKNAKIVLFVGQLIVRKGVYDLLNSFSKVVNKIKNSYLIYIGYGPELAKLKKLSVELGIQNKVKFIDFVNNKDLPKYYATSDVFVLPSHEETWGMVVNEAMACGLPVIVNDTVGSSEDLVKNDINGYVCSSTDKVTLEYKLSYLLSNKKLMETMGKKSIQTVDKTDVSKLVSIFEKAINYVLRPL